MNRISLFNIAIIIVASIIFTSAIPMSTYRAHFVVSEPIDLKGETLTLSPGSVIMFEKNGLVTNGTIEGNGNFIKNPRFDNVRFKGSFINEEITLNEITFGRDPDFWGILTSFVNATITLDDDIAPESVLQKDLKLRNIKIKGNNHTIYVKDFPIFIDPEVYLENINFDCTEATNQVFYAIGQDKTFIVKQCRFINIPEVKYTLCPRGYSHTLIEDCSFAGTLTSASTRKSESSFTILLYSCSGDIVVRRNTIYNCFGSAVEGVGFSEESNTSIIIENNAIDKVTNGGIVFSGGYVWNVIVRCNAISNTHYLGKQFAGEIDGGPNSAINFHGFNNVLVEGNTITDCINSSALDFDGSISSGIKVEKGKKLQVRDNQCLRTGPVALFVVEDVTLKRNTFISDDSNISQSIMTISGANNIEIQSNQFNLSRGKAQRYYPIYITDTGSVHSGRIKIGDNKIISNDKHFIFVNTVFSGDCEIGENIIESSGRSDGTLYLVNNSRRRIELPENGKIVIYK